MTTYQESIYKYTIVTIDDPPVNKTVCRGSDVEISCGYNWVESNVTWIINGVSFNQSDITNNSSYEQNDVMTPSKYSLQVYSINGTTTFQCMIHPEPNPEPHPDVTSTEGIITVIGTYIRFNLFCTYM